MTRFNKPDQYFSQDLGDGALNVTTNFRSKPFKITQIIFSFSQAVTETVTITLDSKNGANYDAPPDVVDLVSETSYIWRPHGNPDYAAGDEINIQCTNDNLTGIVYVTVKSTEIGG